ncbi:MAG TPA: TonB-dependent receptor, partial [Bacteroidia bacterium]
GVSTMKRTMIEDSSKTSSGNYDHTYFSEIGSGKTFTNELQLQFKRDGYSFVLGGGSNDQLMNFISNYYSPYYVSYENLDSLKLASRTQSVFALAELNGKLISEKAKAFSISFGGRDNHNNTFGNNITYQVNPMIKVNATSSLYANISSGYNAPSLYQLHAPDIYSATSGITLGNVNLRPEKSITKEIGIAQKIDEHSGIRIGYFKTEVNDIVEYVDLYNKNAPVASLTSSDYYGSTYLNLGKLTSEGVEIEMHGALGKKVFISGNYSYLRGKELFSDNSIDTVKTRNNHIRVSTGDFLTKNVVSNGLTRRPSTANISLTYYPVKKVFCKALVKYVSKRSDVNVDYSMTPYSNLVLGAYTLVDFISGAKLNENLSVFMRVENIFNVSYTEILGYSTRGRGIYFTVNYNF